MMVILDTNVLWELIRPKPDGRVLDWARAQRGHDVYTTAISEAEMLHGLELRTAGKRREALRAELEATFYQDMAGRVLGFETAAARVYAQIAASRRRIFTLRDSPVQSMDSLTFR
jgi:predicted nucleic acid-binding protein